MKVAPGQVEAVLQSSARYVGLLIYGEDWGLIRDSARRAADAVLGTDKGPFRSSILTREEHGRLQNEAGSLALGGGRRVVRVQDAVDGLVGPIEKMDVQAADVLLILEAGELTPRSKLRVFAERHAAWGAIPCYVGNAGRVASEIKTTLASAGLTATSDAIAYLSEELVGESNARRSELEKLTLYAAGMSEVDLGTAQACCHRSAETSLADAVAASLGGHAELCDALLGELAREGASGAGLLAVLSNQVQRMMKAKLLVDSGQSPDEACRSIMPPMYPRQAAVFVRDLQRWRTPALERLGRAIREADMACKRAASPDLTIATRLVAAVAARS